MSTQRHPQAHIARQGFPYFGTIDTSLLWFRYSAALRVHTYATYRRATRDKPERIIVSLSCSLVF